MWRWNALWAACGIVLAVGGRAAADEPGSAPLLISRPDLVRVDLVLGRLNVRSARQGQNQSQSTTCEQTGTREVFTHAMNAGASTLHYELSGQDRRLVLDICNGNQVRIQAESGLGKQRRALDFQQPESGPITIDAYCGADHRTIQAESFWHLWFQEPGITSRLVLPVLLTIRPEWDLVQQAAHTEQALIAAADQDTCVSESQVAQLVARLGSPRFRERQAAERQLRTMGYAVLAYLDRPVSLDAEQRMRIRSLQQSIVALEADTPQRVAAWLQHDDQIWLALLGDNRPDYRVAAVKQLSRMRGMPISFDPRAEAATRSKQLERLRAESEVRK